MTVARIVIAGSSEQSRTQLMRLLSASGQTVFRVCGNSGELRRTLNSCDDGLLVLAGQLPDCGADELFWDYGDRVQMLLIARPPVLEACEAEGIFRLALPTSQQAVLGAVEMLTQLHRMQLPKRAESDRRLVEQAKRILMRRDGLTEPQAHRALQQYAMDHGSRLADCAARIIKGDEENEGSAVSSVP